VSQYPKPHKVWLFGDTYTFLVTGRDTTGEYAVLEISSPSGSGAPLHKHAREVEGFYVVRGEFMFQYGDKKLKAEEGTFLHLEKGIPHTFKNVGNDTGKLLSTIVPAGFEKFFEDVGVLIPDGTDVDSFSPPSLENIDVPAIIKLAKERYDVEILT
jgi:quercetin dioxygenase-like cupin family protein